MEEMYYTIEVDGQHVAECVPLEYAMVFVEAIFKKFYAMPSLKVDIERMKIDRINMEIYNE